MQTKALKGTASERDEQREVRRTFKMLREVWLNFGIEKMNMHKGIIVKALLNSGTTGMFMDRKMATKHRFKLQKLERLVTVRNVNGMNNSTGAITYQVEVKVYYKGHIKRMRIDICNLGKTKVILGILWLQAYNPEINQKTGEVKMTRYPLLCGGRKEDKKMRKGKRVVTLEEEKIIRQTVDNKREEVEVEADHKRIKQLVPKKFLK